MGKDNILGKAEEIEEQEEFVHNSLEPEGGADGIQGQEVIAKKPHNPKGRLLPNKQRLTKKDTEDPFLHPCLEVVALPIVRARGSR